jgi:hypothetical protein
VTLSALILKWVRCPAEVTYTKQTAASTYASSRAVGGTCRPRRGTPPPRTARVLGEDGRLLKELALVLEPALRGEESDLLREALAREAVKWVLEPSVDIVGVVFLDLEKDGVHTASSVSPIVEGRDGEIETGRTPRSSTSRCSVASASANSCRFSSDLPSVIGADMAKGPGVGGGEVVEGTAREEGREVDEGQDAGAPTGSPRS